jgi:mannose-6-phosphate isomerase-like protein (cupin superfamily)
VYALQNGGDFIIVPCGVEHIPGAEEEVQVLLIETKTTRNTGDVVSDRIKETSDWI